MEKTKAQANSTSSQIIPNPTLLERANETSDWLLFVARKIIKVKVKEAPEWRRSHPCWSCHCSPQISTKVFGRTSTHLFRPMRVGFSRHPKQNMRNPLEFRTSSWKRFGNYSRLRKLEQKCVSKIMCIDKPRQLIKTLVHAVVHFGPGLLFLCALGILRLVNWPTRLRRIARLRSSWAGFQMTFFFSEIKISCFCEVTWKLGSFSCIWGHPSPPESPLGEKGRPMVECYRYYRSSGDWWTYSHTECDLRIWYCLLNLVEFVLALQKILNDTSFNKWWLTLFMHEETN